MVHEMSIAPPFLSQPNFGRHGWSISTLGDLNGDGWTDIALMGPSSSNGLMLRFMHRNERREFGARDISRPRKN